MRCTLLLSIAALALAASLARAADETPARAAEQKPAASEEPVSAEARVLYEQSRASVAQIRVLLGASDSHSATGSGFLVGEGLFVTNYHVVADKALEPDVYRLEFVLPDGRRGPLRILAVDVLHDLAVVAGAAPHAPPLALRDAPLQKGDKGFSFGYPLDQGLSVVEGTYNGRSEEQYYETIHFTGAINAGMSGGPVVDARGRVFGVNVATRRGGQLVSFLVPSKFAIQLIARARAAKGGADFGADVGTQLRLHGRDVMDTLLKSPLAVQKVGEFEFAGKLGEFMRCGAGTDRDQGRPYTVDTYHCDTFSSLYIDDRLHTGMVSFRSAILRGKDLGALRFAHLQQIRFPGGGYLGYARKHHTAWSCTDEVVILYGSRAKAAICVRRYKKFEGLYDVALRIATLGDSAVALHSALELEGMSFDAAMEFARRYIEVIRWNR